MKTQFTLACNPNPGEKNSGFEYGEPMSRGAAIALWDDYVAFLKALGCQVRRANGVGAIRRAEVMGVVNAIVAVVAAKV